jgi:hypothetical protein
MGFSDRLRKGFRLLFNPSKEAKGNYGVKKSLKFFYSLAVLGFIFAAVIAAILYAAGVGQSNLMLFSSMQSTYSIYIIILGIALTMFVFEPVGLFINAALYQLVGRFFLKAWNGGYERTFAASAAAAVPAVLLMWLLLFPVAGVVFAAIVGVWGIVVLVIALSVQQRVTRLKALAVILVTLVIVVAVVMAIVLGIVFALGPSLGPLSQGLMGSSI